MTKRPGVIVAACVLTLVVAGVACRTQPQKQEPAVHSHAGVQPTQLVTLKVPEMDCGGCEVGVKMAAGQVDGVTDVKTNAETRTADVTFDPAKTNAAAIANAITKATGFAIEVPKKGQKKT